MVNQAPKLLRVPKMKIAIIDTLFLRSRAIVSVFLTVISKIFVGGTGDEINFTRTTD